MKFDFDPQFLPSIPGNCIQGGQMKSGQILSRNNSKTVFEFRLQILYTGYLVHQLFTETSRSTMATGFGSLAEVTWTETERRCAVVMILTRKGDILTDSEIADLTGVDCRRVNQQRRGSDRDQGPQASHFPCTKSPDGLQEGQEGPLTSLRLASGSTRTSIWKS